jgi:hypothetical protein
MVKLVPLEHSSTDAARSRNIAKLRHEGYPVRQAAAIAYKEQRKAMKKLARRRRRTGLALAKRNPSTENAVTSALGALTLGGLIGAGAGALTQTPAATGALTGAESGVAVVGVGGLVVAIFSDRSRLTGLVTAGMGLGGLALLGIITSIVQRPAGT